MDKARFFGECPQLPFAGAVGPISLVKNKGYATISIFADTTFSAITFAHPADGAQDLSGQVIPAGTTIYGVRSYTITSGIGVAYHSVAITP